MTDQITQAAARANAAHEWVASFVDGHVRCGCGSLLESLDRFDEHQAEAVVAAVEPLIRAQVVEEIRADAFNRRAGFDRSIEERRAIMEQRPKPPRIDQSVW